MPNDTATDERSGAESLAVFLFAIARHWRQVRSSNGTRIPNHLFASPLATTFLLEGGPPTNLRREWNLPEGDIHLGPTDDTIDDVIAYLGLSESDIRFLTEYYRLSGGMRLFSIFTDRRKFMALCKRTPGFTIDMRDIAKLAAPASPDARYADPETLDELLYLDPGTLVPLNATYEFVLGKGDREAGRRALNELELGADILVREDGIHIAIRDFVSFIDTEPDEAPPHRVTRWLSRLRDIMPR
ncbi:hypothetical protein [Erythrobacter donghaensis]|jgi:hypothetical protein|uniref:hypothetical protein n=1 Tax=Erythrobacter donghaensis TaxID=267135 RepID=UPI00093C9381|nr:hypothetical protein [Erythrobacter donghaensis]